MGDGALADIGDDLHVGVRVGREARIGSDLVVVPHSERAMAEALGVVIAGEGEMMLGLQPAVVCAAKGGKGLLSIIANSSCETTELGVDSRRPH